MYRIEVKRAARQRITHMPRAKTKAIFRAVRAIAADPFARRATVDTMSGTHGFFRLRAGQWRVIYRVDQAARTLTIYRIETRGQVYKR